MASKKDPTGTVTIRKEWITQFNKRYGKLKKDITRLLTKPTGPSLGFTFNQDFEFTSDAKSVISFMTWLEDKINTIIYDQANSAADMWQNIYIDRSYIRGLRDSRATLNKLQVGQLPLFLEDIQPVNLVGTATPSIAITFGTTARLIDQPIHLDAIQILYTRDFAALKGINETMSGQIARVLTEGVEQGQGGAVLAKRINDRVNKIGLTRSRLLARTESVRAYNIGVIKQGEDFSDQFDIEVKYLWTTSQDERVRNTHAVRNGIVYSKDRAFALIGEPNCRCRISEFIPEADTKKEKKLRATRRKQGLELIK